MAKVTHLRSQEITLSLSFDEKQIEQELARCQQEQWIDHVNTNCYQGQWSILPLRCQQQHLQSHPILQSFDIEQGADWQDLTILAELPAIRTLIEQIPCDFKSIRLMKLAPGAEIMPHRDHGLAVEFGQARLHIALQTNKQLIFSSNGDELAMAKGELWYINADTEHWVKNNGKEPRINLVLDCYVNDWLIRQLS